MRKPPITSKTKVLGVIGSPIEHSLSPLLHNYILERLGADYSYVAFPVKPEMALNVGVAFRTLGLSGLNVTLPFKETVVEQMDNLTEEAQAVGAVNTIGLDNRGQLKGHNTDVAGFLGAVNLRYEGDLAGRAATVLGAGGAARAVLYALGLSGARPVYLVNRTHNRAEELAGWISYVFPELPVELVSRSDKEAFREAVSNSYLTVNVTPLGMKPHVNESPLPGGIMPKPGALVFDTVYNPHETLLLKTAKDAGCRPVGGLDMLIIQGVASLAWWLNKEIPLRSIIGPLRKKLLAALEADQAPAEKNPRK